MQIELAITIARDAHQGQMGTTQNPDEPFVQHPMRVLVAAQEYCKTWADWHEDDTPSTFTTDLCVVAALHDVVEDTPLTIESLKGQGLTYHQAIALDAITRKEGQSYLEHIQACSDNHIAYLVKRFDLLDKLPSTKGSLHDKYELAFYILNSIEK